MYDEVPKRRGPDRRPRQRPTQPGTSTKAAAPPSAPRPRTTSSANKTRQASSPPTLADGPAAASGSGAGRSSGSRRPTPPFDATLGEEARAPVSNYHHDSINVRHGQSSSSQRGGQQQQQSTPPPSSSFYQTSAPVTGSPSLANTPAPNVPLVSSLYASQTPSQYQQQQQQLSQQARRAPPRVFHQGLASPSPHRGRSPSGSGQYSHTQQPPPPAAAAVAPSPSSRGLSFILNPSHDQPSYTGPSTSGTSNLHHSQNGLHPIVTVSPHELSSASASSSPLEPTSAQSPTHLYPLHNSRSSREQHYVQDGRYSMTSADPKANGYISGASSGANTGAGSGGRAGVPHVHRIDNAFAGQGMAVS